MGENKQRMLAGDWYLLPDDPELAADTRRRAELCAAYNAADTATASERGALLRQLLGKVDDTVNIHYGHHIAIGAGRPNHALPPNNRTGKLTRKTIYAITGLLAQEASP
ncbi:maltose acetyltransferase domain-containing protein [Streptomyces sp. NPDC002994]|uniref:maltose acetyltransferase domain-containing protein n=1 Tax=Streptomyces sp. NPDC002994 TaxID=3154441 RepID=UPI0033BAD254